MEEGTEKTEQSGQSKQAQQSEGSVNKEEKVPFTAKRFLKMGFHVWRQFDDPYYAGFAAQLAYFFFMSAIPMLIVLTQVLGIFDISMDFVKEWLDSHLSTEMGSMLNSLFNASSTALSNIFLILLAVWSSSSLAFSISRLTTYTLSYGRYRFNFFTERAKAIPMTMLSITLVALTLILYVYGEMIASEVVDSQIFLTVISKLRTPLMILIFFFMILSNYYLLPRIRVPLVAVVPGAVVATIGIVIVTMFYSIYTSGVTNYNILYGAFSNIVALILWFYILSWVICIGMMFNKSWDIHMKRGRLTPEKIKEYIMNQYPNHGEEMYNKLFIGEYDMTDRSLDSIAVKMSRRFDPGYAEKREREIKQLKEERRIRLRIEKEIESMESATNDNQEESSNE